MKKIFKRFLIISIVLVIVLIAIVFICNVIINKKTDAYIYDDVQKIPYNKVGLVLGTSKYLRSGNLNDYFINRIAAAVELFKNGKISYIVVSGDNRSHTYNEPEDMKNELIKNGVPDSVIYLDYAGLRTFDSVIRMDKIFGQKSFTIISQEFHNQRAVYIAQTKGYSIYGFNAYDVNAYYGFKTNVREKFARVKVFIDLLVNKQPKFLGDPIEIGIQTAK